MSDATAGWTVRLLDLSGGAEDGVTEVVRGFADAETAAVFARAYVRDSIEHCRRAAEEPEMVLHAWAAYGEDAALAAPGEELREGDETEGGEGWREADELAWFAANPATEEERDWRSLDPRRHEEDAGADGAAEDGEMPDPPDDDPDDDPGSDLGGGRPA